MGKLSASVVTMIAGVLLVGCAHGGRQVEIAKVDEEYRIGREDVLDISVWRDPDLSRALPVRPDGFISLPMIGEIEAAGKTPTELSTVIQKALEPYVQTPRVTVMVREVNSARVFVTGEVATPGAYSLRGRVSVLQAIALAGGFSDFANTDGILVIRKGNQRIPVRYSDLVSADAAESSDFYLAPGDTVVVP